MANTLFVVSEQELLHAVQSIYQRTDVKISVCEIKREDVVEKDGECIEIASILPDLSAYFEKELLSYEGYEMFDFGKDLNGYVFLKK